MRLHDIPSLQGHSALRGARLQPGWLYTTHAYPIFWHHIAKNAGTYLKHLFYLLDHDAPLTDTGARHDWDAHLVRPTTMSADTLRGHPHGFIVLRNPFQRFLSVYFDKVYGPGGQPRPGMSREFFATHRVNHSPDLDVTGHIDNCMALAQWTARNVGGQTRSAPNWHLVPQLHQIAQAHRLNFHALTVEQLDWQLQRLLSDAVPDIAAKMALVPNRNRSARPARHQDVLVPELKSALREVYADDLAIFREVRGHWRAVRDRSGG